ncbi:MAG: tRNA (guanosine(37)-N1)-methyltransferase TrmD [Halarsenatibacteraceae bacterium]
MYFDILTLFPEIFPGPLGQSITGRAIENGLLEIKAVDIRDFSQDKHNRVDDTPYGGGAGMVMQPGPIERAYNSVIESRQQKSKTIFFSPQGQQLDQPKVKELAEEPGLILLCGHYEGVDERIRQEIVDEEISIGDYVLTGGELPAMVLIDAVSRMLPGVIGTRASAEEDSFYHGFLDYPHYTRPREYKGQKVPDILLSGHHARIDRWRRKQSIKRTLLRRPDLLAEKDLTEEEEDLLREVKAEIEDDINNGRR